LSLITKKKHCRTIDDEDEGVMWDIHPHKTKKAARGSGLGVRNLRAAKWD
jgi:hypothetical protein